MQLRVIIKDMICSRLIVVFRHTRHYLSDWIIRLKSQSVWLHRTIRLFLSRAYIRWLDFRCLWPTIETKCLVSVPIIQLLWSLRVLIKSLIFGDILLIRSKSFNGCLVLLNAHISWRTIDELDVVLLEWIISFYQLQLWIFLIKTTISSNLLEFTSLLLSCSLWSFYDWNIWSLDTVRRWSDKADTFREFPISTIIWKRLCVGRCFILICDLAKFLTMCLRVVFLNCQFCFLNYLI